MDFEFEFSLPEGFFDDKEILKLKKIFNTDEESIIIEHLEKIMQASLREYKEMFLGMGLPSRADEIQQHRLFYLIQCYFRDMIPSEAMCLQCFN